MKMCLKKWKIACIVAFCLLIITAIRPQSAAAQENEFEIMDGVLVKYHGTSEIVVVPDNVTSIGKYAFKECAVVKQIAIPTSVTTIEDRAFMSCIGLTKVIIPDTVTKIGNEIFNGCIGLTEVTLPSGMTRIPSGLFLGCTSLNSVSLPNGLTTIGSFAFSRCTSLNNINLPATLTTIEKYAFQGCGLTEFTMPKSVTSVGEKILYGTPWQFTKQKTNPMVIVNNIVIDAAYCKGKVSIPKTVTAIADKAFAKTAITSISMGDQVTVIGQEAFRQCKKLKAVKLSNKIERLESNTFSGCKKLKRINIPKKLKYIGDFCFESCTSLTGTITLPDGLTTLGSGCFMDCRNITDFVFPKSITEIKEYPFTGTAWDEKQDSEFVIINQILCRVGTYDLHEHSGCMLIPSTIKKIIPYAFKNSRMNSIVIPKMVKKIGHDAFSRTIFLETITIPANTILEENVFKDGNESMIIYSVNNSKAKQYATKNKIAFETIGFEQEEYQLTLGDTLELQLNCMANCSWSSSDSNVASVNAKGIVTAKAKGSVLITAKLYGRRYTCMVTIE